MMRDDLGKIIVMALRYAQTRKTYMGSLVTRWIMDNWGRLWPSSRRKVRRHLADLHDIQAHLDALDIPTWAGFAKWVRAQPSFWLRELASKRGSVDPANPDTGTVVAAAVRHALDAADADPAPIERWLTSNAMRMREHDRYLMIQDINEVKVRVSRMGTRAHSSKGFLRHREAWVRVRDMLVSLQAASEQ